MCFRQMFHVRFLSDVVHAVSRVKHSETRGFWNVNFTCHIWLEDGCTFSNVR